MLWKSLETALEVRLEAALAGAGPRGCLHPDFGPDRELQHCCSLHAFNFFF